VTELLKSKFIPRLIYGLECFSLLKSVLKSLDFTVSLVLMKLFRSPDRPRDVIVECQRHFCGLTVSSILIEKRKLKLYIIILIIAYFSKYISTFASQWQIKITTNLIESTLCEALRRQLGLSFYYLKI